MELVRRYYSGCDICNNMIDGNGGAISMGDYANNYLRGIYEKCTGDLDGLAKGGEDLKLVSALTREYYSQFAGMEGISAELIERGLDVEFRNTPAFRLKRIMLEPPSKYLFVISHSKCFSSRDLQSIETIGLGELETDKQLENLTNRLKREKRFNDYGWYKTVKKLFEKPRL